VTVLVINYTDRTGAARLALKFWPGKCPYDVDVPKYLRVPKTLSVLMTPRNHLSWRNDRAPVFRRGGLGLTIQVEDPA
jgi:hypothetical protein